MIPAGTYRAKIATQDDVQFGRSNNGNDQVAVAFTILVPPCVGQYITWFGFFTEKTNATTIKALRACGWRGDDLSNLDGIDTKEVDLVVEIDTYEDKQRSVVRWVNEPGRGKVKLNNTMSPTERASFARRMKGEIMAVDNEAGTVTKASKPPAGAKAVGSSAGEHDEVPF